MIELLLEICLFAWYDTHKYLGHQIAPKQNEIYENYEIKCFNAPPVGTFCLRLIFEVHQLRLTLFEPLIACR